MTGTTRMATRRPPPSTRASSPLPAPESSRSSRPPWRFRTEVALAVFAILFIAESVFSYRQKSATWDEPIHVADGYFSLFKGDYRFDPEHPPFLRMFAALPLIGTGVTGDTTVIDATDSDAWAINTIYDDTHRFMYEQNDADRLLYRARFMVVLLGVLLGCLVFLWVNEWLGFAPAVAALAMIAFEPNIVAHFSLVTTDAPLTCFAFGAVYFLWRTVRSQSALNVAGLCLFCALSAVTKFSAALVYPAVLALLAIAAFALRQLKPARAALIAVSVFVSSWLAIWMVYRFHYLPSAHQTWVYHFHDNPNIAERVPGLTRVVQWIDGLRLLPNVFSEGFLLGQAKAQQRGAFLSGAVTDTGWWYFFPVAIAIKTPLSFLALALGGLALLWTTRRELAATAPFILIPIAAFLLPPMLSSINIGLRHVLVIYPFFALLGALMVKRLLELKGHGGVVALGVLTIIWLAEYGRVYPDPLAFFNTTVGGPEHGAEYLVDSNLDWGQDLKGLKVWMDTNRVPEINLAYFGNADPAYYGIRARMLNGSPSFGRLASIVAPRLPGYVAVSKTIMSGVNFDEAHRDYYKPLRQRPRVASIGHSIDVYFVDRRWW
jgi:hypothetical protein